MTLAGVAPAGAAGSPTHGLAMPRQSRRSRPAMALGSAPVSSLSRVRSGALRLVPVLAIGACLLAACGKSAGPGGAGPGKSLAPVAEQGAVSVVTGNTSRIGGSDAASDAAAVARSVYPGLTRSSRPGAVVVVEEGSFETALAASSRPAPPQRAADLQQRRLAAGGELRSDRTTSTPWVRASLGGVQVIRVGSSASVPGNLRTLTLPPRAPAAAAAAIEGVLARATGLASPPGDRGPERCSTVTADARCRALGAERSPDPVRHRGRGPPGHRSRARTARAPRRST